MKTRVIITIAGCLLFGAAASTYAQDSEYKPAPVTISKDKVWMNGKQYYWHTVQEKQTLYSLAKVYGVTLQQIYDSNPNLKLETEGLKTYQILLIPIIEPEKEEEQEQETAQEPAKQSAAQLVAAKLKEAKDAVIRQKEEREAAARIKEEKLKEEREEAARLKEEKLKEEREEAARLKEEKLKEEREAAAKPAPVTVSVPEPQTEDGYILHTVKWFEDIESISKKYGISKEVIMKANGMSSPAVSRKQLLRIPTGETAKEIAEKIEEEGGVVTPVEKEEDKNIFETIGEAIADKAEEILYVGKSEVNAALVLPFNASKQPNDNNLDFYSGVLLAAKDLKEEGVKVDLSVYDMVGGNLPVTEEAIGACDVVIGPISTADLTKMLSISQSRTPVVSPLEPKAMDLVGQYSNLIQAPSSTEAQCEDLVNWIREDFRHGDKVILFTEKGVARTALASALIANLENSGIEYSTMAYGLLESKDVAGNLERAASQEKTTRILVASESEAFVSDVVRNANLLSHRKFNVALYAPSKIRSFETIEVENLHNTNLHVSISYYVDYDSPKVQKFLMQYRALFNAEPGPFAFQGYDTAYNFCKLSSQYGRKWTDKLDMFKGKGLQSNFKFSRTEDGGHANTAVRRIVYGPDFNITLIN